eukprot:2233447-Amphidinium_carterae.2
MAPPFWKARPTHAGRNFIRHYQSDSHLMPGSQSLKENPNQPLCDPPMMLDFKVSFKITSN